MTTPPAPTADPPAPPSSSPPTPTPPTSSPPGPTPPSGDPADELAKLRAVLATEREQRKAAETKLDQLQRDGMSEQERLIAEAEKRGRETAAAEHARALAAAEFRALAAGRIQNPDAALAVLDLSKLVKDGAPDKAAIAAVIEQLAVVPAPPGRVPTGPRQPTEPTGGDFFREQLGRIR